MSDVLFNCPKCKKSLAVDEEGIGVLLKCTDCGTYITPPVPGFYFDCPFCESELAPSRSIAGQNLQCPYCRAVIKIPASSQEMIIDWRIQRDYLPEGEIRSVRHSEFTEIDSAEFRPHIQPLNSVKWLRVAVLSAIIITALWATAAVAIFNSSRTIRNKRIEASQEILSLSRMKERLESLKKAEKEHFDKVISKLTTLPYARERVDLLRSYLESNYSGKYRADIKKMIEWEDDQLYAYVKVKYDLSCTWATRVLLLDYYCKTFPRGKNHGVAQAYLEHSRRGLDLLLPIVKESSQPEYINPDSGERSQSKLATRNKAEGPPPPTHSDSDWSPETSCTNTANSASCAAAYTTRRTARREELLNRNGGSKNSEDAVIRALRWLKQSQIHDGSWQRTGSPYGRCQKAYKPALTALSLLAYFAHGETKESAEFGKTIAKGIRWLINNQDPDGRFRDRDQNDYSHPIGAFALCEAYVLHKESEIKAAAKKAVSRIIESQGSKGAWGYNVRSGRDSSYSAWCVQALKAAQTAGLHIDGLEESMVNAVEGLLMNSSPNGGFGYRSNTGEKWLSSAAVLGMQLLGSGERKEAQLGLQWLSDYARFSWQKPGTQMPVYHWYYITQAMFKEGGKSWKTWNTSFRDTLIEKQKIIEKAIKLPDNSMTSTGCWTSPSKNENRYGKVYTTALCALMLQTYYRYAPLQTASRQDQHGY